MIALRTQAERLADSLLVVSPVSRNCADGKHRRCLATVYIYPPEGGERIVPCDCDDPACDHATEAERAKQVRTRPGGRSL